MSPYELRSARINSGLTLAAVARAAGTSTPNLSAYELGTKRPNEATLARLTAAIRAGANSAVHSRRLVTVPSAAAAIRSGLRQGWTIGDLLRVVRELRSNAKYATSDADRGCLYSEPSTTGDRRWDSLLAGVAEMDNLRAGRSVPAWSRGHELPHMWFVGTSPSLHAYDIAHTPPSLAARGIVIDRASLESV